jgi:hypothetical protein
MKLLWGIRNRRTCDGRNVRVVRSTVGAGDAVQMQVKRLSTCPIACALAVYTAASSPAATSDAHFPRSFRGLA